MLSVQRLLFYFQGAGKIASIAGAVTAVILLSSPVHAQPFESVRINIGSSIFNVSDAWDSAVPKHMGFYAEEGLDVAFEAAQGGGPALQQLMAGQVVATITGNPNVFPMINQGAPIKIVASLWGSNRFYPAVPADSPIMTIADLKGKRMGTLAIASANTLWAKAILAEAGLDPEMDVEFVGVGSGGNILNAFNAGEIDAMQSMETVYDTLEARGYPLRRFNDLPSLDTLSFTSGVMVLDETIEQRPEVVVGLLRANAKGLVWSLAQPEAALKLYWKEFPEQRPRNMSEEEAVATFLPALVNALEKVSGGSEGPFGYVQKEKVETVINYFHELGALDRALPADAYYDGRFIEEANDFDRQAVRAIPPPADL